MGTIVPLEAVEAAAFGDLYAAASPDVAAAVGLSVTAGGGATLLAVNRIDVLALNRVIGLGLRQPAGDADLEHLWEQLRASGAPRYFIQVAPVPGHETLIQRLERAGLAHYNNWMRLQRHLNDLDALPAPSPGIDVREIDRSGGADFSRIVAAAFQYPPMIAPLTEGPIGRPGWRHYLAFDGDTPIAAAAMFVSDTAAWFGFAATDAAHRRRGAQHALVMRRLRDAARAGCTWISVETAEDTVIKDAPSFRNLRRLGFTIAYRRPNYLWTKAPTAVA